MRSRARHSALLIAALLASIGSPAQEANVTDGEETIEEVKVMGARSLALMRRDVIDAEDRVFDLYNTLNDEDDYDIICETETRIGSQLPKRICQAQIYREQLSRATIGEELGALPVSNMTRSSKSQQIVIDKMRLLAAAHPELLDALRLRRQLEKRYEKEHARRYGE